MFTYKYSSASKIINILLDNDNCFRFDQKHLSHDIEKKIQNCI